MTDENSAGYGAVHFGQHDRARVSRNDPAQTDRWSMRGGRRRCWKLRRIHSDELSVGRERSMTFRADQDGAICRLFGRGVGESLPRCEKNGSLAYRLDRKMATLKTLHAVHS
jgi:hypothetical protein